MKRQADRTMIKKERYIALGACVFGLLLLLGTRLTVANPLSMALPLSSVMRSSALSLQDSNRDAIPAISTAKSKSASKPASPIAAKSTLKPPAQSPANSSANSLVAQRLLPRKGDDIHQLGDTRCLDRPGQPRDLTEQELAPLAFTLPLTRFRSTATNIATNPVNAQEFVVLAHPSNFGWRFLRDLSGQEVRNAPIVVLHETVGSYESAIGLFTTPHDDDDDQVSYHALIREDGKIVYTVPPTRRAYGAGDSVFVNSARQEESVKTNPSYPASVNNFAYHLSLVSPEDGYDSDGAGHSGYTRLQYESLAWLVAKTGISEDRITTHQLVDRSGTRRDPRSFNVPYFLERLRSYPSSKDIAIGCGF